VLWPSCDLNAVEKQRVWRGMEEVVEEVAVELEMIAYQTELMFIRLLGFDIKRRQCRWIISQS
jgi:ribulose bisphosphate carboxylase small subunit